MGYTAPLAVSTGALATAAEYNTYTKDNLIAIYAGGMSISGQSANRIPYASSATQLATHASLQFDGTTFTTGLIAAAGTVTLTSLADLTGLKMTATTTGRAAVDFWNATSGNLGQIWFGDDGGFEIRRKKTSNLTFVQFAAAGGASFISYLEGTEETAPAAPAANFYRIFAQDNGAGKTQLMVIFSSGAAQQMAIQP